jgi:flagellar FliJ protein
MAQRFVFSLQPLLEERKRVEDVKQRALRQACRGRDEQAGRLRRLSAASGSGRAALHDRAMAGKAADARFYDAHLRYLTQAIASEEERCADWSTAVDGATRELLAANRDRRLVEKLRERRLRAFEFEAARREELELEEANRK